MSFTASFSTKQPQTIFKNLNFRSHRDAIVAIRFFQLLMNRQGHRAADKENLGGRFLALSKEGQLCIYGLDMELIKSITVSRKNFCLLKTFAYFLSASKLIIIFIIKKIN